MVFIILVIFFTFNCYKIKEMINNIFICILGLLNNIGILLYCGIGIKNIVLRYIFLIN